MHVKKILNLGIGGRLADAFISFGSCQPNKFPIWFQFDCLNESISYTEKRVDQGTFNKEENKKSCVDARGRLEYIRVNFFRYFG